MSTDWLASTPIASPHVHAGSSVSAVMIKVMLALTPATVHAFWLYGWPAIFLWFATVFAAIAGEAFCLRMMRRRALPVLKDGSAMLTGWLLALSLPPWAPLWLGLVGGLFATIVAKQVFGGIGQNLFNPAMAARVALLISFPVPMTQWLDPLPMGSPVAPDLVRSIQIALGSNNELDAIASASLLGHAKTELARGIDLTQIRLPAFGPRGEHAGSLGEASIGLLAAGGLALLLMRVISWHIPVAMLLGAILPAAIGHALDPSRHLPPIVHLLSGGLILGAFFIATDYVTSPSTRLGQFIFGLGCGVLTWLIRTYGGYPEGVAFAVLLMNALTPAIDRWVRPRIYGRDRRGHPLELGK
ncbi:MAG: RnfABCDGE type electron transport complex subunit D [Rhodocyclaceae bacterium]|nr:RnfABCDGE type electron transport complex subunit D [Rhodocyclaceae bacterium]